jgi:hypothetical protein
VLQSFFDWLAGSTTFIILEVPADSVIWGHLGTIDEAVWKAAGIFGWSYRVDPADPEKKLQRHVHVAQNIHMTAKNKQRSWNLDGTRHDSHLLNQRASGLEKAKTVARSALGLAPDFPLEHLASGDQLLQETDGSYPGVRCVVFTALE